MPRGGARPGSGRPRGANKVNAARTERIAAAGATPLEVLVESMRYFRGFAAQFQAKGPNPDPVKFERYMKMACDFATKAAPYVHPHLAATTLRGDDSKPIRARVEIEFV